MPCPVVYVTLLDVTVLTGVLSAYCVSKLLQARSTQHKFWPRDVPAERPQGRRRKGRGIERPGCA